MIVDQSRRSKSQINSSSLRQISERDIYSNLKFYRIMEVYEIVKSLKGGAFGQVGSPTQLSSPKTGLPRPSQIGEKTLRHQESQDPGDVRERPKGHNVGGQAPPKTFPPKHRRL